MATPSLFLNPSPPHSLHFHPHKNPKPTTTSLSSSSSSAGPIITCGPRDNRGPIIRGRTLSTEAILAVQSLKRSPDSDPTPLLSRLIKSDLLAALSELQRQDRPLLALAVLAAARAEPWYKPDCSLYADMVKTLSRNGLVDRLENLVEELLDELERGGGIRGQDLRGPSRLVKALVGSGKAEGARGVYGMMKKGGCVPDEHLFGFTAKGLRRLGDEEGAEEVERDYHLWCEGGQVAKPAAAETVVMA